VIYLGAAVLAAPPLEHMLHKKLVGIGWVKGKIESSLTSPPAYWIRLMD
jgi:hypothetical protein